MDHRGTGRSTLLDCVAAQATTTGSPWGSGIDTAEVPACAQALEKKYGNLSSFSMTSAAMDMATFISDYSNGADTVVYAVSYGTALVERLIHLDPPEVTGYVLDGVATSSGTSKEFEYFSTWDADFGDVGDAFLALCATQSECGGQFVSNSLPVTLQNVITQFDNDAKSTCAALLSDVSSEPASYILRRVLGSLLQSTKLRTLIPPIVYRLNRCASNDVEILTHFFTNLNKYLSTNDVYDGDYDESLAALVTGSSSSIAGFVTTVSKENATYKAAFIVFLVLFVATLALAGLFAFRWLKLKRENERNRATDDLPDDIEISTPPEVEATSPELTTAFSTQRSKEARRTAAY
ncbi:hypothetical protein JG688_00017553 [Phytophthora aleatoria]|uniref:AB hydrolase-1 domain-containing protein n=1 Tax=Phytophthora aleatoria TaxID=2496075 RepID=A0A8J5IDM4_9STRA|nr:hypothetical protein JG688_00017553 [Phytophthora aleatoria]